MIEQRNDSADDEESHQQPANARRRLRRGKMIEVDAAADILPVCDAKPACVVRKVHVVAPQGRMMRTNGGRERTTNADIFAR
jgi:hypothetical protein